MALKLYIILLTTFGLISSSPQKPIEYNTIEGNHIVISNQKRSWNAFGTTDQLKKAFGFIKPKKSVGDVLDGFDYTYKYKNLEVYFNKKSCEAITLSGSAYQVLLDGKAYTVGDNLSKVMAQFPVSCKKRRDMCVLIWLTYKEQPVDAFIRISYNKANTITEIWMGNDNS